MQSHEKFACYRDVTGIVVAPDKQEVCVTAYHFFSLKAHPTKPPGRIARPGASYSCRFDARGKAEADAGAMVSATGFEPVTQ